MSTSKRGKTVDVESTDRSPKNFYWSKYFEDTLLDLLLREARKENRPDGSFTESAFRNVVKDFNRIRSTNILKKRVQSKIKTMKQHFVLFHGAFHGLSGFAWHHDTKMFEAGDELWEQRTNGIPILLICFIHMQENPKLEKLRGKSCQNWDKLFELYGDNRANGEGASSVKEKSKNLQRVLDFEVLRIGTDYSIGGDSPGNEASSYREHEFYKDDAAPGGSPEFNHTQQSIGTSRTKLKSKSTLISVMKDGYKTMAVSIDKLSMALFTTGEEVARSKVDVTLNYKIYDALASLGLEENYRVRCYFYLCENPTKAAILVAAPNELRRKLLPDIMKSVGDEP